MDGAIHRKGGPEILAACRALRASHYGRGLATGQAVATTAGNLPARWVIHTVGPVWSDTEDKSELLASCYRESLRVADELGAETVAFPAVSTGIFRWPLDDGARIAVETVRATDTKVREVSVRPVQLGGVRHLQRGDGLSLPGASGFIAQPLWIHRANRRPRGRIRHSRRSRRGPCPWPSARRPCARLSNNCSSTAIGAFVRVMGVDPGLTRCGLSMVEGGVGRTVKAINVDVVRTPPEMNLALRLMGVADTAEQWMDTHKPEAVAIERVFSQHNVSTAMATAQAAGVIALAAARRGIPVHFHTPSEVKAAVTGNGQADKAQVTAMVTRILGLAVAPKPADAADALAIAICHCWRAPMIERMAKAEAMAAAQQRMVQERLAQQRKAVSG